MSDAINDDGIVFDPDTGEMFETHFESPMAVVAQRRHDAKAQKDGWAKRLAMYDAILLRHEAEGVYDGGLVIKIRQRTQATQHVPEFLAEVPEEVTKDELVALVSAATRFDAKAVPDFLKASLEANTEHTTTKPWIESAIALRPAPAAKPQERTDDPA